eukprot:TRINITY_DN2440_c0_g1_i1.p1 TRINITY_DN2440_c0_g1~~TRINITY_DN2440_c0_g1_i1.p1  ORF type:complete len:490 (+),score=91.75 TRINITY_DN2440_c0_g1_i1:197-1471(+)
MNDTVTALRDLIPSVKKATKNDVIQRTIEHIRILELEIAREAYLKVPQQWVRHLFPDVKNEIEKTGIRLIESIWKTDLTISRWNAFTTTIDSLADLGNSVMLRLISLYLQCGFYSTGQDEETGALKKALSIYVDYSTNNEPLPIMFGMHYGVHMLMENMVFLALKGDINQVLREMEMARDPKIFDADNLKMGKTWASFWVEWVTGKELPLDKIRKLMSLGIKTKNAYYVQGAAFFNMLAMITNSDPSMRSEGWDLFNTMTVERQQELGDKFLILFSLFYLEAFLSGEMYIDGLNVVERTLNLIERTGLQPWSGMSEIFRFKAEFLVLMQEKENNDYSEEIRKAYSHSREYARKETFALMRMKTALSEYRFIKKTNMMKNTVDGEAEVERCREEVKYMYEYLRERSVIDYPLLQQARNVLGSFEP